MKRFRFRDNNGYDFPNWRTAEIGDFLSIPDKEKVNDVKKDRILTVKLHRKGVKQSENVDTLKVGGTAYYRRHKGQFIFGKQNLFNGAFDIIPEAYDGYVSSGDVPALDFKSDNISEQYFLHHLSRENFYKYLERFASGTGSKRIHENTFLSLNIKMPSSIQEQHKISGFLSAWDKLIEKQNKKVELLKDLKKGYVQRIFKGDLRFKDENGNEYPKWEKKRLSDMGKTYIGLTYSPKDVDQNKGKIVLRSNNIKDNSIVLDDVVKVVIDPEKEEKKVKRGDILICSRNGSQNLIGKSAIINEKYEGLYFGAFMAIFRPKDNSDFFSQLLSSNDFKRQVQRNLGARINQITSKNIREMVFSIPSSKKERNKIGNFLKRLNNIIEQEENLQKRLGDLKKGYIQRIFSS